MLSRLSRNLRIVNPCFTQLQMRNFRPKAGQSNIYTDPPLRVSEAERKAQ